MNTTANIIYSDLNGRLACPNHMGSAAESAMNGKTPERVRTTLTVWERYNDEDIAYFTQEVGFAPECESCRVGY